MKFRKWVASLDLITVLVLVAFVELALNRLAVPVLRPPGGQFPPEWHRELDRLGLFAFYLATLLSLGVGVLEAWDLTITRRSFPLPIRVMVETVALAFFALAGWSVLMGGPTLGFQLESCFTLLLLVLAMAAASQPGDTRAKLGLLIVAVPFLLHYYGSFALRLLLDGDPTRSPGLPERLREAGQWAVALGSLGAAFCFAPRPLLRSLTRPGPLVIASFISTVVAEVLVRHQDVGMELASRGLGIELGPAPPPTVITTFVVAAFAVTWTLVNTLSSPVPARRMLGAGFALVVLGGYGFAWPLELLTVAAGVLALTKATGRLPLEEEDQADEAPVIPEPVWQAYVDALARQLGAERAAPAPGAGPDSSETRLSGVRRDTRFKIDFLRPGRQLRAIQIDVAPSESIPAGPPVWTLATRAGGHPQPPAAGPPERTGDAAFDRRFRTADAGGMTARLLDEGLRARAAALLDGWVAIWPDGTARWQVYPGRGAPLDHPVPQTELALRGGDLARAGERLVLVLDLLVELSKRAS
jgi:hypothetical protein